MRVHRLEKAAEVSVATITTRDGRVVRLSERETLIAELLVDLRADLARVDVGSIQFHVEHTAVRAKVELCRTARQMERRSAAAR